MLDGRQGLLSTHSAALPGYPFGTLVPFCLDEENQPVLLISHLAQHARNLRVNTACGLLLSGEQAPDVQQSARLSLMADALPDVPQHARERYFNCFPHTREYHEQLNFHFWRLKPLRYHLNAGFAAARWISPQRLFEDSF